MLATHLKILSLQAASLTVAAVVLSGSFVRPAAPAAQGKIKSVASRDLMHAFQSNAAEANEKYLDKRVTVSGRLIGIRGGRVVENPEGIKAVFGLDMSAAPTWQAGEPYLVFRFTDKDKTRLAQLKAGQEVTVTGDCQGWSPGEPVGGKYLYFWNCTLNTE
jgi:hypothetical protein